MFEKPLSALGIADIVALISHGAMEGLALEFKIGAIGSGDKEKREFLGDVSAFANASGGDLVLGVREVAGTAAAVEPIPLHDPDGEKLRLLQIVQHGLEPRLSGVEIAWLPSGPGLGVMVVRVPRSWNAPHRVVYLKDMNFYVRNTAGKNPMSVEDLRRSFIQGASLIERARAFCAERMELIRSDQAPLDLAAGGKFVVHVIPVRSLTDLVEVAAKDSLLSDLRPMGSGSGWNSVYTADGFATYSGSEGAGIGLRGYSLLFRNGVVEIAATVSGLDQQGREVVDLEDLQSDFLHTWVSLKRLAARNGISLPYFVFAHMSDCRDAGLVTRFRGLVRVRSPRRVVFSVGELTISAEHLDVLPNTLFKPVFDRVANAFGLPVAPAMGLIGD